MAKQITEDHDAYRLAHCDDYEAVTYWRSRAEQAVSHLHSHGITVGQQGIRDVMEEDLGVFRSVIESNIAMHTCIMTFWTPLLAVTLKKRQIRMVR